MKRLIDPPGEWSQDWARRNNALIESLLMRAHMTGGHLVLNAAFDRPHIVLDPYHIWVDSTGDLRIKSTAPTSDTDGTVVGTQT